jgi:Tol biopolymer transport system component
MVTSAFVLILFCLVISLPSFASFSHLGLHQDALATSLPGDNGKIAFGVSYGGGNISCEGDIVMMNPDGTDPATVPHSGSCGSSPSFSPDGRRIVFDAPRYNSEVGDLGGSQILAVNLDGSNHTTFSLTNMTVWDMSPSFSPDGTKIVFSSIRDGGSHSNIYVVNVDGTGSAIRLTNSNADDGSPVFSPDGTKIVFTRAGEIYSMNANDGSNQTNLTNNSDTNDSAPSFSPDGKKIAFAGDGNGSSNWDIYIMNAKDGTNKTRLTSDSASDTTPAWSPDSTKIAFSSWRDGGSNSEIYVMNADGSKQTRVTHFNNVPREAAIFGSPSWGPAMNFVSNVTASADNIPPVVSVVFPQDGSRFYFSSPLSKSDIHVRGTAFDFGSGVENVEVRVDSGAFHRADGNLAWEYSIPSSSVLHSEGIHNITIRATDAVGNTATNTIAISANLLKSRIFMPPTITRNIVVANNSSCMYFSAHDSVGLQKTAIWDPNTKTCTISSGTVVITNSGSIAIPSSVTLEIAKSVVFQNNGTLNNAGSIKNDGKLNNSGTIMSSGLFKNYGTLINSRTLSNSNILDNFGIVKNSGRLVNSGYIIIGHHGNSGGKIVGLGPIVNSGHIY